MTSVSSICSKTKQATALPLDPTGDLSGPQTPVQRLNFFADLWNSGEKKMRGEGRGISGMSEMVHLSKFTECYKKVNGIFPNIASFLQIPTNFI